MRTWELILEILKVLVAESVLRNQSTCLGVTDIVHLDTSLLKANFTQVTQCSRNRRHPDGYAIAIAVVVGSR